MSVDDKANEASATGSAEAIPITAKPQPDLGGLEPTAIRAPSFNATDGLETRRHRSDPSRRRATFGLAYPNTEIELSRTADVQERLPPISENRRRAVAEVKLYFKVPDIIVMASDFMRCKFHRMTEITGSQIVGASFIDCTFRKCIFGGTFYRQVRFERCSFTRCDFGMAQFTDCQFHQCSFIECTGEHMSFSATEISPHALLAGFVLPRYNYDASDGPPLPKELVTQWLEIRRSLAAQLLKSNAEIYDTDNSDAALVELKQSELEVRLNLLSTPSLDRSLFDQVFRCFLIKGILVTTRAGTSMRRLILIGTVAIPLYALLLSVSAVTFQGTTCKLTELTTMTVLAQLARATSLFLAIGYTAFVGSNGIEVILLTLGSTLGLLWYALLAAVVIRRVYR